MIEDIYINYLRKYYEEHGTINNISPKHTFVHDGVTINIYDFLKKIKYNHKKYISGKTDRGVASKLSLERYQALDEMGYDWSVHPPRTNNDPSTDKEILYLRKHFQEHGTINNISMNDTVTFEGEQIKIGQFLTTIRARHHYFVKGSERNQSTSKLSLTRYKILEEMNIDWTPSWTNTYDVKNNDICLEYLTYHFQNHGTINDILGTDIVIYKGKELKIGYFIVVSRRRFNDYQNGKDTYDCNSEIFLKRYEFLSKLGFIFSPQKEKIENDLYIEYLKEHHQKHGTINDITSSYEVTYKGQKLRIGGFLARTRTQYNQYQKDPNNKENKSKLLLQRYEELQKLGFDFTIATRNGIADFARKNNFSIKQISKLTSIFNGNAEKAFKIRLLQEKLKQNKKENRYKDYKVSELLEKFNINLTTLLMNLDRNSLRTGPKVNIPVYNNEMPLEEFCTKNNFNHNLIMTAVCLKLDNLCNEKFDSLLNRCLSDYKKDPLTKPASWIYAKYGNEQLLKQKIKGTNQSCHEVLIEMSNECISIEKAMANVIFRKNRENVPYIKGVYLELVNFYEKKNKEHFSKEDLTQAIETEIDTLKDEYFLTEKELAVITKSFYEYKKAISDYRIFDVAFENNKIKRVEKIKEYNLDDSDITKAFFAPLQFSGQKLIGQSHELFLRRQSLITIGQTWENSTLESKKELVKEHKLKKKEVELLETTTKQIKETKVLVKK